MKNNETGEFELVVGDRQLLSAFFIVVVLCAMAFAMGYVVGQSAPKAGKGTAGSAPPTQSTAAADSRPQPLAPAPVPAAATPAASDADAKPVDSSPQPTTQPAQGTPSQPAAAVSTPPPAPSGVVAAEDLPAGNFWQVMATGQP